MTRKPTPYDRHKEQARDRQASLSRQGRDVADWVRPPADPARRERALADLEYFLGTYFPETFYFPFCADQRKVIAKTQQAVTKGGLFAEAMPRGGGKTQISVRSSLWAVLGGYRCFPLMVGANEEAAKELLDIVKGELETNDLLDADFSDVTGPVRALEGIANRCAGQHYKGQRTGLRWTAKHLVLPAVPGSPASGAVLRVVGITGRIRGMTFPHPGGRTIRPDLVVVDDPQTDESAWSPGGCAKRERILMGAILGLAGPGTRISGLMPCTVIRPGDLADRMLDRDLHPAWKGERTRFLHGLPEREDLWSKYAELRAESFKADGDGEEATEFYRKHRADMDRGAVASWPERFDPGELSAVQHAMNVRCDRGDAAFFAEYQNDPAAGQPRDRDDLTADEIAARVNRLRRGLVPAGATRLTAAIDVQGKLLFWSVCAWSDDFTGAVVDYGTFPDQKRAYFTLREARPTIQDATKVHGLEASLQAGLFALTEQLLARDWPTEAEGVLRVERCLVDANWGDSTEVVRVVARTSPHAALLLPSHGRGVTAGGKPLADWQEKQGERRGLNWLIPAPRRGQPRHVIPDTNFWKSFVHARLAQPPGGKGALALFGDRASAHRLLADHLTAETREKTTGRGREVDDWRHKPGKPDNHWLDCLVLCAVGASVQGVKLLAAPEPPRKKKQRLTFAQMREKARAR